MGEPGGLQGLDREQRALVIQFKERVGDGLQRGRELAVGLAQAPLLADPHLGDAHAHQADHRHRQQPQGRLPRQPLGEAEMQAAGNRQGQGPEVERRHLAHAGKTGRQQHRHPVEAQQGQGSGLLVVDGVDQQDDQSEGGHAPLAASGTETARGGVLSQGRSPR